MSVIPLISHLLLSNFLIYITQTIIVMTHKTTSPVLVELFVARDLDWLNFCFHHTRLMLELRASWDKAVLQWQKSHTGTHPSSDEAKPAEYPRFEVGGSTMVARKVGRPFILPADCVLKPMTPDSGQCIFNYLRGVLTQFSYNLV